MADDALPQAIRDALGTTFKKKPADTLDQWAALCAKAGMGDVDDVASCRAEDFNTWIGKDCIVLTNFLRRLHTPAQQCPQSPKRLATQDAAAGSPSKEQEAQQQGTKRKAALPAIRNNHKINSFFKVTHKTVKKKDGGTTILRGSALKGVTNATAPEPKPIIKCPKCGQTGFKNANGRLAQLRKNTSAGTSRAGTTKCNTV